MGLNLVQSGVGGEVLDRERRAAATSSLGLGIAAHGERTSHHFLYIIHSGALDQLEAALVDDDLGAVLLKHTDNNERGNQ